MSHDDSGEEKISLSKEERLILANQLKILEKLYPEEAEYYSQSRKALEEGYALHYRTVFQDIYDEMPESDSQEVIDILNMYRAMCFSTQKAENKDVLEKLPLFQFPGFDANEELNQFMYTQYYIVDLNRFQELCYGDSMPEFNSHEPMLETYRSMLKAWRERGSHAELSPGDIEQILKAGASG